MKFARPSQTVAYLSPSGTWIRDRRPGRGERVSVQVGVGFKETVLHCVNLVCYIRIILNLLALMLILHARRFTRTIAFNFILSLALDAACGILACAYKQSSIIGRGWRLFADVLSQLGLCTWVFMVLPEDPLLVTFVTLATCTEIGSSMFTFGVMATAVYPCTDDSKQQGWGTPIEPFSSSSLSHYLGCVSWLAKVAVPISACLGARWITGPLMPFAFWGVFGSCRQLCFVISNWQERSAKLSSGVDFMRMCTAWEQQLLVDSKDVSDGAFKERKEDRISWHNHFYNGQFLVEHSRREELHAWVLKVLNEMYSEEPPRAILTYGFISSPAHGSIDQAWHIDYTQDVSNLFVPMSPITNRNATQFIRGRPRLPMTESQNYPEPAQLLDLGTEGDVLEVCQSIVRPFSITKLFPSVVHRGIANKEDSDRVVFFISTTCGSVAFDVDKYMQDDLYNTADDEDKSTVEYVKLKGLGMILKDKKL